MRIAILFPVDSRKPGKGFREEVFEIPKEVLREMFEVYRQTKNVSRAIDVPCRWVADEAAKRWCRVMNRGGDENCINEYLDRQGERIMQQCEASVRKWIADVAEECIMKCGKERNCLESCIKEL